MTLRRDEPLPRPVRAKMPSLASHSCQGGTSAERNGPEKFGAPKREVAQKLAMKRP